VLDIAYLRVIQGMVVMAPKDEQELRDMLYTAVCCYKDGPIALRYPRGNGLGVPLTEMKEIPIGKAEVLREGTDICLMPLGHMVPFAMQAAEKLAQEGISVHVINPRYIKPLDEECIRTVCERFDKIITIEDGQIQGGFGSAVGEFILQHGLAERTQLIVHGIPDEFVDHGTQEELWHDLGLDAEGITAVVKQIMNEKAEIF
jgi:1-deoxy-D-xylulose-5-phosphate synthase